MKVVPDQAFDKNPKLRNAAAFYNYPPETSTAQQKANTKINLAQFRGADGAWIVKIRASLMDSDEAIVALMAHEMWEINSLEAMFAGTRGELTVGQFMSLTDEGINNNLHSQAWDKADAAVDRWRNR